MYSNYCCRGERRHMKDFKGQFTQIGKQGGTPEGEGDQQLVVGGWPLSMDHLGGADLPCVAAWHSSPPPPPTVSNECLVQRTLPLGPKLVRWTRGVLLPGASVSDLCRFAGGRMRPAGPCTPRPPCNPPPPPRPSFGPKSIGNTGRQRRRRKIFFRSYQNGGGLAQSLGI